MKDKDRKHIKAIIDEARALGFQAHDSSWIRLDGIIQAALAASKHEAALEAKQEAPNGFCSFCGNPASEHYCYFQSPEKSQYNHVASPAPEGRDKTLEEFGIKYAGDAPAWYFTALDGDWYIPAELVEKIRKLVEPVDSPSPVASVQEVTDASPSCHVCGTIMRPITNVFAGWQCPKCSAHTGVESSQPYGEPGMR